MRLRFGGLFERVRFSLLCSYGGGGNPGGGFGPANLGPPPSDNPPGSGSGTPITGVFQQPNRQAGTGLFVVTRQTADRVEYAPAFQIGPNDIVSIGPIFTNTANCFYSTGFAGFDAAKLGPRIVLAPGSNPRLVKVRNLNEIGVYSTVIGEGVSIDIQFGER